ncbi:MAG: hypothetical protein ACREE9_19375 [Stellaceae bacterium]
MKTIAVCSALLFAATASGLAQTPAHRAATGVLHHQQAAPGTSGSLAADQFASEQAAKTHCPGDAIVWANLGGSKAYHMSGNKYFGKTKHGAFMCQKEADQSGFHSAGHRAHETAAKNAHAKTSK